MTTPAAEGPPRGNGELIMYVEDEAALITLMTRSLRVLKYTCESFSDPAAGLEAFRANPDRFAAVLTDVSLPGMSGVDLAEKLLEIKPGLRIALVSGNHDVGPRPAEMGITVRIPKPYTVDVLAAHMQELLRA